MVGIAATPTTDAALDGVSSALEHRVDLALAKVGVKVSGDKGGVGLGFRVLQCVKMQCEAICTAAMGVGELVGGLRKRVDLALAKVGV